AQPAQQPARVPRTEPQLLADQLVADELIKGAPSRNGGRLLTAERDPWTHNAWDQVEWGQEEEAFAQSALERQRGSPVPQHLQDKFNADPAAQWDTFYAHNKDNFFKDRAWLQNEFPELKDCLKADSGPKRIVEVGCGNGSTLFPLLAANENPLLDLHGYDYSKEAVSVVKTHASFDPKYCTCEVWDLSSKAGIPPTVEPNSVDVLTLIFCFSALHPDEWAQAVENVYRMLKPGGILLFRDYGRNDLAMLRFKANRYMQDGLYVRGDNTRVYFFERDDLAYIFGGVRAKTGDRSEPENDTAQSSDVASPHTSSTTTTLTTTTDTTTTTTDTGVSTATEENDADAHHTGLPTPGADDTTTIVTETESGELSTSTAPSLSSALANLSVAPSAVASPSTSRETLTPFRLDLLQLGVDRRLLLNRKRQIKMFRVWMQGRWRKPLDGAVEE
ncbi:methyltransferase, partial [Rhodotorula sp. JG-1b]